MTDHDTDLPVHPITGLAALGWRRDGRPIWPILGGSGEGDGAPSDGGNTGADDGGEGQGADPDGADPDGPGDGGEGQGDGGDEPLGAPGRKALEAEKAKRKALAERARKAEQELAALKAQGKENDPEVIRSEAEKAATAKANARIVRAEVKAAAAGKLADPADAYQFLDLTAFEVDDDGAVDAGEIADAIEDLLKKKPYLAAAGGTGRRFAGGGDGGKRGRAATLADQIRDAEKAGDWKTARRLKLANQLNTTK
ncbi:hypothetical protein [Allonocardiopsis opalescens]|uniref:Scaffolding protein n=1 Tax=Allonocardiopsis opalescens TaxID=1144618 RepID=A0A2T0PPK5_9ACTN|nr:hypothetical protein [Allonocardiopsis opalescens]PRX90831.1 hypothetical protein CLV72_11627 [Allonocardiopsis opalescens]